VTSSSTVFCTSLVMQRADLKLRNIQYSAVKRHAEQKPTGPSSHSASADFKLAHKTFSRSCPKPSQKCSPPMAWMFRIDKAVIARNANMILILLFIRHGLCTVQNTIEGVQSRRSICLRVWLVHFKFYKAEGHRRFLVENSIPW
jgi:hypothetical protein